MIHKIVCPVDFSVASNNAIEYAAKFAQTINSKLTLFNVQHIPFTEGANLFSGAERDSVREARVTDERMKDYCSDIIKQFNIEVDYEIYPSLSSFERVIADESKRFDLVTIGTNGTDDLYQFYFGSHSFKVAINTAVPVMIIPEQCTYAALNKITYVSDFIYGDELLLKQLKVFINNFNLQLHVIHICEKETPQSNEVYQTFCNCIGEVLKDTGKAITYQQLINADETGAILNVVNNSETDLIAVSFKKHGFLYNLFHKDLVEQLLATENFPVLIFHE